MADQRPSGTVFNRYVLQQVLSIQREAITMGVTYMRIASTVRDPHGRDVLREIAGEELAHYQYWKGQTARDVHPDRLKLFVSSLFLKVLGYTFTLKYLTSRHARHISQAILDAVPDAKAVCSQNETHHLQVVALTDLIDEERFHYTGAIALGMNDAIVEFTGMLAGLTFALQNSQLIAITGVVAGISASLSMAASEYLSLKSEASVDKKLWPPKAAMYTGATYLVTVALLILPFLVASSPYVALPFMLAVALATLFCFTFYISVARGLNFRRRFAEMALISLGIALLSFVIGLGVRLVLHVTV